MVIRLVLPLPPTINQVLRGRFQRHSKNYRETKSEVAEYFDWVRIAVAALGEYEPLPKRMALTVRWINGRADWDGRMKVLQDALAAALGFNDARIVEAHVYKRSERRGRPRCEVELGDAGLEERTKGEK